MTTLAVLLCAAALHYLLARAEITRSIWERYPRRFDAWASCAACSGSWLTAATTLAVGLWTRAPLWGVPWHLLLSPLVGFLAGMMLVPAVVWLQTEALARAHIAPAPERQMTLELRAVVRELQGSRVHEDALHTLEELMRAERLVQRGREICCDLATGSGATAMHVARVSEFYSIIGATGAQRLEEFDAPRD